MAVRRIALHAALRAGYAVVNVSGEERLQKRSDGSAWFVDRSGLGGWSVRFRVAVLDGSPAVVELHVRASDEQSIPRGGLSGTFLRQATAPTALLRDPRVAATLASDGDQVRKVAGSSRSRSTRQNDAMLARIALVNDAMATTGVDCTPVRIYKWLEARDMICDRQSVRRWKKRLHELGYLDSGGRLTARGRRFVSIEFPGVIGESP